MNKNALPAAALALIFAAASAQAAGAPQARVGELVQTALGQAQTTDLTGVSVDISGAATGLTVAADADAVLRTLKGVIEYSARSMTGRTTRRLSIRIGRNGANVDVELRDSGPGVAAEDLLKIYGGAPAPRSALALLSQSNRLAQSVGGRLLIDSEEGVGADYLVELPLGKNTGETVAQR
ncbi:MAG: ATP-binding protein [Elusimicrobia bacterium]|nr:ATP-binding protein [Elusimicrobiota bacterium]